MDFLTILKEVQTEVQPLLCQGAVADYIPELASVDAQQFAMNVLTTKGESFSVGSASKQFSIQSISKLFTLSLALRYVGNDLWKRLGREPSGSAFNSLVQLEYEQGIPRNPFINAGAIVVSDVLLSQSRDAKKEFLHFLREICSNENINYNLLVRDSEHKTGHRNKALANFIKSFKNLENDVEEVLEAYYSFCSVGMSCEDLSKASLFLANEGKCILKDKTLLSPSQTKYVNSLLLTCGTYDAVGDFAYRVGLPAKSGVGGGIVAVMPRKFSVSVYAPALNNRGNSLAGTKALELFTTKTGISIF